MANRDSGEEKKELETIKELVDELYKFRDCYFETHSVTDAKRKRSDVTEKMKQTLLKLEEKEERMKRQAEFLLQKGRCLNVASEFSTVAEECLSRAVKLQPDLIEGWNTLGEQYWKKGDLIAAKNCFTGALQQSKNKVSLCNLSMVLRQLPPADGDTKGKLVQESMDLAQQAVQLDETDGRSWFILGNAYLLLFFNSGQNPQLSQKAIATYAQSEEVDKVASSYPELHYNRASLFQYEEMFNLALAGYSRAFALDPEWEEAATKEQQLLDYLGKVTELIQNKGKVKARRLRTMLSNLNTSALGPCLSPEFRSPSGRVGSLEPRTLSSLKHGVNVGVAALGKVVFSLASEGRLSFTFGMVDSEETCLVVMVYNMADSWGVLIGDTVVVPEPQVKRHSVTHRDQTFDFRSIRVDSPLLLIVNGKHQNLRSQSAATVSYKPHE
ncbi:tetratricopeptide repeat protein 5-like [Thalassophryne amazonica]|uniref:LOW QUALITY PROTEIN: tetratricopeptide repeat protein 5-like n=1 Tax=Thalassophryne amazonica TaxID=390379 RepID=UPI0014723D8F|nr:LOW QUALITY PROTEIN: tetratricopeptide repeat protein 5-like [Thalassophryne amazonica]XP_034020832.1 tetratricopeptide repeat protein 5-like [Thalassophryne amazonica]